MLDQIEQIDWGQTQPHPPPLVEPEKPAEPARAKRTRHDRGTKPFKGMT